MAMPYIHLIVKLAMHSKPKWQFGKGGNPS